MPTQIKEDSKVAAGPSVVIVEVNIEDKAGVQVWGISLAKNAHNNLPTFPGVISAVTGIFPHSGENEKTDNRDSTHNTHNERSDLSMMYLLLITNGPNQENTHKRHRNIEREDYYNIQSSNIF